MSLATALAGLTAIPQWFVYRLTWDAAHGKYNKQPATPDGPWVIDASMPQNWLTYEQAAARVVQMQAADTASRYTPGFWFTEGCGYWFLDLDKCIDANRQYTPIAATLLPQLPGCFFEFSSSGNGVHVIGRGTVPQHSMRNKEYALELYTDARGIAFGLDGQAWGSADVSAPAINSIASIYFPPRAASEAGAWLQPRSDWQGPADDEALIARALQAESVASKLGNRASFAQLWRNAPELERFYGPDSDSERDAALAAHLAFWTGCDAPRIERLMRKSGLVRPKWDEHRTYLRDLTINGACERQVDVYREPRRADPGAMYAFGGAGALPALPQLPVLPVVAGVAPLPVLQPLVSAQAKETIDRLLDLIHGATSWEDVHNTVIPTVRAAGVPSALMSRIENAINKRLDLWDAKLPVAKLRALIAPPVVVDDAVAAGDAPDWMSRYVYVQQGDRFHNLLNGVPMSRTSFSSRHNRDMPLKDSGMREDATVWALERWNIPMVHDIAYYPGKATTFDMDGLQWANIYTEASHPAIEAYTADGVAAIERFCKHLQLLCGGREAVYMQVLAFMAHNVQHPGVKVRWCPLIKGTQGDGKSMIGNVMDAAMGGRNVSFVGPETVANNGGFTDWAHGHALAVLEELYLAGKDRHRIANIAKPFITNNKVTIHGKGDKPKNVRNTCNQIAFTNASDAVPIETGKDRRWFIIFTPFETVAQLIAALGITEEQLDSHFDSIFASLEREPGQWRKWLLEFDWRAVERFAANRLRVHTVEKESMAYAGMDDVESLARSVIDEGGHGVSVDVLSSAMFSSLLKMKAFGESVEIPKSTSLHHMINRLGFVKVAKPVKWAGASHRCWVRPGVNHDNDTVRALLDLTTRNLQPNP